MIMILIQRKRQNDYYYRIIVVDCFIKLFCFYIENKIDFLACLDIFLLFYHII